MLCVSVYLVLLYAIGSMQETETERESKREKKRRKKPQHTFNIEAPEQVWHITYARFELLLLLLSAHI